MLEGLDDHLLLILRWWLYDRLSFEGIQWPRQ